MKVIRKIILIVSLLILSFGCANTKFYFFGIDLEKLKEMDKVETVAGAITSVGMHIGGHFLAGAITDNKVEFDGLFHEKYERDTWYVDNGGFILQHGFGLLLTSFDSYRFRDFTNGYVAIAALETWTYPLREDENRSDFRKNDGDFRYLEFSIYSTVGLHNLLRTKWYKEKEDE